MTHTIIIEDDPMVAQINRQYMQQIKDFCVDAVFDNAQSALDYLQKNVVNLVLLDVFMPGMNGITLLRKMRADKLKCAVIIITAATEMNTVHEALRLGVIDYLIKPYSFERFKEAVQKYIIRMNLLSSGKNANQEVVDQLLKNSVTTPSAANNKLEKGLNAQTLEAILYHLEQMPGKKHTCETLSKESNLSKVTVRRYLNYLIETGRVSSSIDYETGGRPRIIYNLL